MIGSSRIPGVLPAWRTSTVLLAGMTVFQLGCSLQPSYVRPAAPIPSQFPSGNTAADSASPALPSLSYQDIFRDSALQHIIRQGLVENRDLRIAVANVAVARAQYRVQRAQQLPVITGGVGAVYGENANVPAGGGAAPVGQIEQYTVDVGMSALEIDLFGRIRSLSNAALNEYFASEAGAHIARLTLVSEIASAYLTLAADRSRLIIAKETEKSAIRSVELTEARHREGISSILDVRQGQTILAQSRADIASLTARIDQDRNALDLLVGTHVDDSLLPQSLESVDQLIGEPPLQFGTEVLLRRPDIARAEFQLKAANARIGAARAALFPRVSLSALLRWTGGGLSQVFDDGTSWNVQPSARATIFDGALTGAIGFTRAQRELLVAQYEKTIQTAFREVADALARKRTIQDEFAANTSRVEAATQSYDLSYARYRGGIDGFLVTLDAQRQLYAAQQVLIATRFTRADNIVALYRTIAGDAWGADSTRSTKR